MMRPSVSAVLSENGQPEEHVFQIGGVGPEAATEPTARHRDPTSAVVFQDIEQRAAESAKRVSTALHAKGEPVPTKTLLAQLRARLRVVEREIKARKLLEQERDQIKRLIAAATNERNNLRAIRAAG
jgi:hypothetical protein